MKPTIKRKSFAKKEKPNKSKIYAEIQLDFILQFEGTKPISAYKLIYDHIFSITKAYCELEIKLIQSSIKGIESGACYTIVYSALFENKKCYDAFFKIITTGLTISSKERKALITKITPLFYFVVPTFLKFYEKGIEDNVNLSNQLNGLLDKDVQLLLNLPQPIITKEYNTDILKGKEIIAFRGQEEVVKEKLVTPDFLESLKCFTSKILTIRSPSVYERLKKAFGVWKNISI